MRQTINLLAKKFFSTPHNEESVNENLLDIGNMGKAKPGTWISYVTFNDISYDLQEVWKDPKIRC